MPLGNDAHLWFATLDALQTRVDGYANLLDSEEQARAARFRFEHDRERYILGHGLMRELLGRYLEMAPENVRMLRGPFGKPFIEDHPLHFNLSDTKDAILIAFTRELELGADVETMTRTVDHEAVSEHYFTPEEIGDIAGAPDGKRRFLELWTRKEAVLKASGVGIMDDLRVLRVDAEHNASTITHEAFLRMAALEYHLRTWHIGGDHIVSLAAAVPMRSIRWLSAIG
jgi:4'-phosphopantetheinyl transferase